MNHWFPGLTPPLVSSMTCRQIMDSYRFIAKNSEQN